MDKTKLTKTALASALGISRQAVHRYEKQGMPCDTIEAATAWRDATVQPRINATEARHRSGDGGEPLYWASRARREQAEANIAEMREAELRGTFINKAGAERAVSTGFRLMRDMILAVPDRLPIDRALAIEFRRALEDALNDAGKSMPDYEP